jgi:hypothetical protein
MVSRRCGAGMAHAAPAEPAGAGFYCVLHMQLHFEMQWYH